MAGAHGDMVHGVQGERCVSSLHHHGEAPAPAAPGRVLDWEAARFQKAATRLELDRAVACALRCAARSIEVELPLERDDGTLEI